MLLHNLPFSCLQPGWEEGNAVSSGARGAARPQTWLLSPTRGSWCLLSSQLSAICQEQPLQRRMLKYISYYGLQVLWPFVKEREFCQGNVLQFGDVARWETQEFFFLMCSCKIQQITFSSALFPVYSWDWKEFTREETTLLLSDSYQDSFLCKRNSPVAIISQIIIALSPLSTCCWCWSKSEVVVSQKWMEMSRKKKSLTMAISMSQAEKENTFCLHKS